MGALDIGRSGKNNKQTAVLDDRNKWLKKLSGSKREMLDLAQA
jgi:hypothetical protein